MMNYLERALHRLLVAIPLLIVGCSDAGVADGAADSGSEGYVSFGLATTTRSMTTEEVLSVAVLKIYSLSEDEASGEVVETLIRRYEPMGDMPDLISLIGGEYRAKVLIDFDEVATTDATLLTRSGETDFEVVSQQSQSVDIECTMDNRVVRVEFDDTITSNLKAGYSVVVMTTDSYLSSAEGDEMTPQLVYSEDMTGYFILPTGVSNISWRFLGEKVYTADGGESVVEMSGVIESPAAAEQTTLKFSFPKYLELSESLSLYVDESEEQHDDAFNFAPQPQITGEALYGVQSIVGDVSFEMSVESFLEIRKVTIEVNGQEIVPLDAGVVSDSAEATFVFDAESTTSGVLTINKELFNHFYTGGEHEVYITAVDSAEVEGEATLSCKTEGFIGVTTMDLWSNTATLLAMVLSGGESIKAEYRVSGESEWQECGDVTSGDGESYTIQITPDWIEGVNEYGNTVYQMANGVRSNVSYECRLVVDDLEHSQLTFLSDTGGEQVLYNNMSDSTLSCFLSESSTSSSTWGSGNNSYSTGLCTWASLSGDGYAKLTANLVSVNLFITTYETFAAGNLFYGQFEMDGTSGIAKFGQAFTWSARPHSFKYRYAANIGTIDYADDSVKDSPDYDNGNIAVGKSDCGRVYMAIVDWSARHEVTSGLGDPSNTWDPVRNTSVTNGKIIGYASTLIYDSTETMDQLYDNELEIYYYDKETKPTGTISIVVSCATSNYGDYLTGSTDSKLWVDDFELVY